MQKLEFSFTLNRNYKTIIPFDQNLNYLLFSFLLGKCSGMNDTTFKYDLGKENLYIFNNLKLHA